MKKRKGVILSRLRSSSVSLLLLLHWWRFPLWVRLAAVLMGGDYVFRRSIVEFVGGMMMVIPLYCVVVCFGEKATATEETHRTHSIGRMDMCSNTSVIREEEW